MTIGAILRQAGAASPLVPAVVYTVTLLVTNLAIGWLPDSVGVALVSVFLWLGAGLFLFTVVTWHRDDDWLAAGFLLGMTVIAGGWLAASVAQVLLTGSLVPAIVGGPSAFLGIAWRAIIAVPIAGGIVALARRLTPRRRLRGPNGAPPV